jgi:hypothetical protein
LRTLLALFWVIPVFLVFPLDLAIFSPIGN